jgi:2-polyprenyl-3-methyl-5-hydroxy-6-metoxy-1,4-benzoquinol methylase
METETVTLCDVCASPRLEDVDRARALKRCGDCGFVFDSPRPTLDELVAYYSKKGKYDQWLADLSQRERLWKRRLRKLRRHARPGSLLDVGTGIGQLLALARPRFREVLGTEVSASAIEAARERFGLEISQGTLDAVDFPAGSVDNITLFHVLEHVHSPSALLRRCHELLAEGGRLFIAVPNDDPAMKAGVPLPKIALDGTVDEIHLSHFREETLMRLLSRQGFRVVEIGLDPYFVAPNLYREGKQILKYGLLTAVRSLRGINRYPAIWCVAERSETG